MLLTDEPAGVTFWRVGGSAHYAQYPDSYVGYFGAVPGGGRQLEPSLYYPRCGYPANDGLARQVGVRTVARDLEIGVNDLWRLVEDYHAVDRRDVSASGL